jgi:hypothetical protein
MELIAAFLRVRGLGKMRFYVDEQRDGMVARGRAGQLLIDLRHVIARRCNPPVLRVRRSPLMERVFGKKEQMQRLIGEQLARPVTPFDLQGFVPDSQRAHLELAEVPVRRGARRRQLRKERDGG